MTVVAPEENRQQVAMKIVLRLLRQSQRAYSLGEVVDLAVQSAERLSADDARAAAAALVDSGAVSLTDGLQLRAKRIHR